MLKTEYGMQSIKISKMKTLARNSVLVLLSSIFFFISSCNNNIESFTPKERALVQNSVQFMADSIAKTVSKEGPAAWLRYFENAPEFFMAADGQLVFPDINTATSFINITLIKMMPEIQLRWSNIRIDPLTINLASISAAYHEDITDSTGKMTPHDGYFTGITHQTSQGWKLLNAHWSSIATH
jgi:hypothetical protein